MKKSFKKSVACMLTAVMTFSVVPVFPHGVAKAATTVPSVTSYATKEQLMTVFDLDGVNDTVGKLVFGRNGAGDENEWYIVGRDSGVAGDNVVLFAADHLLKPDERIRFENSYDIKSYSADWGCSYTGITPAEVYANHYGGSMLRAKCLEMVSAGEDSFFCIGEKTLMNFTTITNRDTKNHVDYTTTDKLYGLWGHPGLDSRKIFAGSSNNIPIADKYAGGGEAFHLRTPYLDLPDADETAIGLYVYYGGCGEVDEGSVRFPQIFLPATNVNLSSVLFASSVPINSATEAKGTIAGDSAMRLRMDGVAAIASTAIISNNVIKVSAATGENVTLVVQGNNGTDDWYFSKPVSGIEITLTSDEINAACSFLSGNPDFSACKIWIEKTGTDGLLYAKNAKTEIQAVDVTVTAPLGGQTFSTVATCTTAEVGNVSDVSWSPVVEKAAYNTVYTASVTLKPKTEYVFSPNVIITMNEIAGTVNLNTDGTLTVAANFSTGKAKLLSIKKPDAVEGVGNGVSKTVAGLGLPKKVEVKVEDGSLTKANVQWDVTGCNYKKSKKTAQKFTVNGTVTIPDTYDINGISTNISISVSVLEEGVPAKDTILKDAKNQAKYKITKAGKTGATVVYVKPVRTSAMTVSIPATITVGGISYKVTGIANNAFKNNKKLTKVTIGKYVQTIGTGAFCNCTKLKTVTMGNGVVTIGSKAFYKCTALTKITIPSKVSKIGKQAFYGCKRLKNITFKTKKLTTKKVGSKAFKGIYSKSTIKVPKAKYKAYKTLLKKKGVGSKVKYKKL